MDGKTPRQLADEQDHDIIDILERGMLVILFECVLTYGYYIYILYIYTVLSTSGDSETRGRRKVCSDLED